jgi:citrate synthase
MPLEYWTAGQSADFLGVSLNTLYAYISRKGIRSVPVAGSREHRYLRADIEGIRERRKRAPDAAPIAEQSAITLMSDDGPYYRGRSAAALADDASFEAVAALLWDVAPDIFDVPPQPVGADVAAALVALADRPGNQRALSLFPILEAAEPRAYDLSREGMIRTGIDILRWLAAIILRQAGPSDARIHEQFAAALNLSVELGDLVRRLLVLSADHGFEQGTYAVRVVASTGVTPWRAVATGISVVTGRPSRFGDNDAVRRFVAEILAGPDGSGPVWRRIRDGEELPGFASLFYSNGDPRAQALMTYCDAALSDDRDYRALRQALDVAHSFNGLRPNFALLSTFVELKIGLAHRAVPYSLSSSEAPFIIGRAAGWLAHAIEQAGLGEAERRDAPYRGPLPNTP